MDKKGQQEIVGFVLIVVLVVVGLMVFLAISLRGGDEVLTSVEVSNVLDVLMRTTTECAIVYDPNFDDFEDLFKSCSEGKNCENLDKKACDYLNESLEEVVRGMMASESGVSSWALEFLERDEVGEVGILRVEEAGNCTGRVSGAQRSIYGDLGLVVRMRMC